MSKRRITTTTRNELGNVVNETVRENDMSAVQPNLAFRAPMRPPPDVPLRPSYPRPPVTFVIPAYNAWKTVRVAVESVFGQTMQDVDCVVIDDGSTDDTVKWLRAHRNVVGDRLTVLEMGENYGVAAARNYGLRHAYADIVIFLDADDIAPPDRAAAVVREFADHDGQLHLLYGQEEEFTTDVEQRTRSTGITAPSPETIMMGSGFRTGTAALHRRLWAELGVWLDESMVGGEDHELLVAALEAGANVHCSDHVMLWRRRTEGTLREGLEWGVLRGYIHAKHETFLRSATSTPVRLADDMRARIQAAREHVGADPVEDTMREIAVREREKPVVLVLGDNGAHNANSRVAAVRTTTLIVFNGEGMPDGELQQLCHALYDPSVAAVWAEAGGSGAAGYTDAVAINPRAAVAVRGDAFFEVGGFDCQFDSTGGHLLDLMAALHHAQYRILSHRNDYTTPTCDPRDIATTAFSAIFMAKWGSGLATRLARRCVPDISFVVAGDASRVDYERTINSCWLAAGKFSAQVVAMTRLPIAPRWSEERSVVIATPSGDFGNDYSRGTRRATGDAITWLQAGDEVDAKWVKHGIERVASASDMLVGRTRGTQQRTPAAIIARRISLIEKQVFFKASVAGAHADVLTESFMAAAFDAELVVTDAMPGSDGAASIPIRVGGADPITMQIPDVTPVLTLTGCHFNSTGGGQRPAQMARAFARERPSTFMCHGERVRIEDGVLVAGQQDLKSLALTFARPGVLVWTLPDYVEFVGQFPDNWVRVYDVIDNWAGFAAEGHMSKYQPEQHERSLHAADVVTCSAKTLAEQSMALGIKKPVLVRNGSPERPLLPTGPPPARFMRGENGTAVFVGSLWGQWIDWSAFSAMAIALRSEGVTLNIVGSHFDARMTSVDNVAWHGELPWAQAMEYVAHADVGIIPFCKPEISRYVDPVKIHEYIAGQCRAVATDVMTELHGRDYVHLVQPEKLAQGVLDALEEGPLTLKQVAQYCRENSWTRRCEKMMEATGYGQQR